MSHEQSYGIVPLQMRDGAWYVLLVQHGSAHYWGFPKGHSNPGEAPTKAAERELFEETALHVVRYVSDIQETHYRYTRGGKVIDKSCGYFGAVVEGTLEIQAEEISGARWIPLSEAGHALTHDLDKTVLRKITVVILEGRRVKAEG